MESFLRGAMVSPIFIPTRSLPPCGLSHTRPPGFLPRRSVAIRAAKRASRNATPVHRPAIPSIVKKLSAGQASVVQVITFSRSTNSISAQLQISVRSALHMTWDKCDSKTLGSWFLHAVLGS